MTTLNDIKITYPIFKFFKNNYNILNRASKVLLVGSDSGINLFFNQDSQFYLLYGYIEEDNDFSKWLNGKSVYMNEEDIVQLNKCLKKNVLSIEYDDNCYTLSFIDKDGNTKQISLISEKVEPSKTSNIMNMLKHTVDIDQKHIQNEVFNAFVLSDDVIFEHATGYEKIIEYPSKKIQSQQKECSYSLSYSDRSSTGIRFVSINSQSEKIILKQIFSTI